MSSWLFQYTFLISCLSFHLLSLDCSSLEKPDLPWLNQSLLSPKIKANFAISFSRAGTTMSPYFCHSIPPHNPPLPSPERHTALYMSTTSFWQTHFFKLYWFHHPLSGPPQAPWASQTTCQTQCPRAPHLRKKDAAVNRHAPWNRIWQAW